jgi:large subunit ribosomal protein L13
MTNLRIYKGESHPHEGLSPKILNIRDINEKNTRRVR